ncbi:hypothetical protein [Pseudonocardia broussonetiae]|uniref:MinD-like ATPase involved in chromosome partitioning or flagellar assembly n=1 Tax=Pseudonocardia broussonetiae TaxID=2736640 RepID=A0A6M6JLG9_9PSEU|nr:hypothetical protein [Pseudonocardia broussonetiae]QJY47797.1 hypothetical protein HOP40_19905 [Pseudonocardia broussonetiae]
MLISFLSAKGSPGVTTAVLALATRWPRSAIAVDLDPQGGDILAGVGGGRQPARHGIVELLVEARTDSMLAAMGRQVVRPAPHSPPVLAGFGAPGQAANVPWDLLGSHLVDVPGADVVADCGRFTLDHPVSAVLRHSDLVVLVAGSSLRIVRAAARTLPLIRRELGTAGDAISGPGRLVLVIVGPDLPYNAEEIAGGCQAEVAGTLPDDPVAASVWSDGELPGRGFQRSRLQRAAGVLARSLADRAMACREVRTPQPCVGINGRVLR